MKNSPSICCLCLTADRQRFTDRAVKCFLSQTYTRSELLIYDTGKTAYELPELPREYRRRIIVVYDPSSHGRAIGTLRNEAIELLGCDGAEVIAHWDSDDWIAPERLARQMQALEGYDVVGFHNLLFADVRPGRIGVTAWEYDYARYGFPHRVVGTSLMYPRQTWERRAFEEKHTGEDSAFIAGRSVKALNGVVPDSKTGPLMIAEVHGANSSGVYQVFDKHNPAHNPEWRRAPEWDTYCRETLYP